MLLRRMVAAVAVARIARSKPCGNLRSSGRNDPLPNEHWFGTEVLSHWERQPKKMGLESKLRHRTNLFRT